MPLPVLLFRGMILFFFDTRHRKYQHIVLKYSKSFIFSIELIGAMRYNVIDFGIFSAHKIKEELL